MTTVIETTGSISTIEVSSTQPPSFTVEHSSDDAALNQRLTDLEEGNDGLINGLDFLNYYLLARDN